MNGKGDRARPISVDSKTFDSNWDRIFGKKEVKHEEDRPSKTDALTKEENSTQSKPQRQDLQP